jgi:TolB-like protein
MQAGSRNRMDRRLAAILAADVAGYSRLMGEDEDGTLSRLKALRRELIDPKIDEHKGRIVKTTGDGLLVEFPSVVGAVRCAVEVQGSIAERNTSTPAERRIEFRIGIHQGDVLVEDGDIFGDGVNIAARLEALAEPGGICVSDRVQNDAVGRIDVAFDDLGPQQVKNIARPVHVYRVRLDKGHVRASLALPDKPSIAVLPFQNMSGDPEQEYFADGMVEEIITALSRVRWLFVIARNSTFTYKGQAVDVKRVGRELGVRYVLEGSVRKGGNRVRITAQLIEAETGAHLWADRFDGALEDVFDLQDQVASSVAGVIEPALEAAERHRSSLRPTSDLTAHDLYLRALPDWLSWEKERVTRALHSLEEAIARDPHYGPALASAAFCYGIFENNNWTEDAQKTRKTSLELALRALQASAEDPAVLVISGFMLAYFGEDVETSIRLHDRSLHLNPSSAFAWHLSGWVRLWSGRTDKAIEHFEKSLRLNPRDRRGHQLAGIGIANFFERRFDIAIEKLLLSAEELPSYVASHRFLAACYAHMGRFTEARQIVSRIRALTPIVIPEAAFYRNPVHRELYLSGLRLAVGEAE